MHDGEPQLLTETYALWNCAISDDLGGL